MVSSLWGPAEEATVQPIVVVLVHLCGKKMILVASCHQLGKNLILQKIFCTFSKTPQNAVLEQVLIERFQKKTIIQCTGFLKASGQPAGKKVAEGKMLAGPPGEVLRGRGGQKGEGGVPPGCQARNDWKLKNGGRKPRANFFSPKYWR